MQTPDIEQLNQSFGFADGHSRLLFINGEGDIPVMEIENEQASARISLQGAHILSWIPLAKDDVIWLSEEAKFAPGKSVRGGVPICWPWFGAHETDSSFPAHGFARTVYWQVTSTKAVSPGETQVIFSLDTGELDDKSKQMWPLATIAEYRLVISNTLTMELTTFNNSEQPIVIGEALHTYFKVDEIENTRVYGLEDKTYLDKTDDFKRKVQAGPILIEAEVDRVYLDTDDDVVIDDNKRKIRIKKQNSQSTVVWNPWQAVADKMGDLGKNGFHKMLCVESANAAENVVKIQPGESHSLYVNYAVIDD